MCQSEKDDSKFLINITCKKCEGNIGVIVEHEEMLGDEVETVRELTYLGDSVSAGGGCKAAVTARTRCGWDTLGSVVNCCILGDLL